MIARNRQIAHFVEPHFALDCPRAARRSVAHALKETVR
jgi:hypothetical protein